MPSQRIRPVFWWALGLVAVALGVTVAAINIFGNDFGEPCADSYSCKGFLLRGAECLAVDSDSYCTIYCDTDSECPSGSSCTSATPTVLTVKTSATDEVCVIHNR